MMSDELSNAFFIFFIQRLGPELKGGVQPPPPYTLWKIQTASRAGVKYGVSQDQWPRLLSRCNAKGQMWSSFELNHYYVSISKATSQGAGITISLIIGRRLLLLWHHKLRVLTWQRQMYPLQGNKSGCWNHCFGDKPIGVDPLLIF